MFIQFFGNQVFGSEYTKEILIATIVANADAFMPTRQSLLRRPAVSFLSGIFITGLLAMGNVAAAPSNDHFADRIPLSGARLTVTGSNIDATLEPGEPSGATVNSFPILKTVWWTWTAPADGGLAVSVAGSDFDAVFNVYSGSSVSNLAGVPSDRFGSPAAGPQPAAMRVIAGRAYQIAAGSWSGQSGGVVLNLAFVPRAANDDFANRIPLGSGNVRATGSTIGATAESGEPLPDYNPANGTLWWSWTAATSGPVLFQATAATPAPGDRVFGRNQGDLSLRIFNGGNLEGLTLVTNWSAWNELAPPLGRVSVEAVAGRTYQISVGGKPGYLNQFELTVARTQSPEIILTGPLSGAEFIAGAPVQLAAEAIDPDGSVAGAEFFARAWLEGTETQQADEARPFRGVLTNLPPALYYLIARATDDSGIKSDSIPVEFNVRPVNDAFAHRIPFTGAFVTVTSTLANASTEAGGPPELEQPSIWWAWTAPASASFTLTAATASGEVKLGVFTGTSLASLSVVPAAHAQPGRVVIQAEAGLTYVIAISGVNYVRTCTLKVAQTEPPDVTLISPTNGTRIVEGSMVTLSAEATDPDGNISRVEFFDVFSSSLGSVSNAPFSLTRPIPRGYYQVYAVATDNHGVSTRSEEVRLEVVPVPPANDAFASRIPFTGSFITVTGDTANATFETGEVDPGRDGSAWWEWTAPTPGDYCITVASSPGYQPWLAIYTGSAVDSLTLITNSAFYSFDVSYSTFVTIHALAGERYQIAASSGAMVRVGVARTLPPTVTISNPENDAVFVLGETVQVRVAASDPDGTIDRVEIYLDGSFLAATLTNEPFVFDLPLTYPSYHRFQARAIDNHGVAASSEEVRFLAREPGPANDAFADRIPFTGSFVSISGSAAHATLEPGEAFWVEGGSAWWEWTAPVSGTFTIGVQSEVGYWPSLAVLIGTELPGLNLLTNEAYRGNVPGYSVHVVIEAEAGVAYPIAVEANGQVTLSVARTTPPSVNILQPAPNSVFHVGDVVVLQADASDADGALRSVEFFLDGQLFGTVTNEPFALQRTFLEGNSGHFLRARATDDRGVSTFSDDVYFEVKFHPPVNDHFENRTALQGWFVTLDATDWESTRESGEPTPPDGQGSVWWRWAAPASGRVILSCDRSSAFLAVCLGTNVTELNVVASTDQPASSGSQLEFDALAGADYAIVFQTQSGTVATFRLSLVLDARQLIGPRMSTPGLFAFDLHTTFERTWVIEATTNLVDWTPLATNRPAGDTLEFLDPESADHPGRFYRAVGQW